jgi:hypothetical protein
MRAFLGILMTFFYLLIALLLFSTEIFDISKTFRIILGILFFLYGLFRGYRFWKMRN